MYTLMKNGIIIYKQGLRPDPSASGICTLRSTDANSMIYIYDTQGKELTGSPCHFMRYKVADVDLYYGNPPTNT
jgi:hypothetical protein